jgi:hypothetical protein
MVTRKQCTKVLLERKVASKPMASSHESEALVMSVIIQEVISDLVVELNPTTVNCRTDQAVVSVVSNLNASKWKSYSP